MDTWIRRPFNWTVKSENVEHAVFDLISEYWNVSPLSNDWVDGALVCLYKFKGEKGICDNYRRLTLLDAVGKVFNILDESVALEHMSCTHS